MKNINKPRFNHRILDRNLRHLHRHPKLYMISMIMKMKWIAKETNPIISILHRPDNSFVHHIRPFVCLIIIIIIEQARHIIVQSVHYLLNVLPFQRRILRIHRDRTDRFNLICEKFFPLIFFFSFHFHVLHSLYKLVKKYNVACCLLLFSLSFFSFI